MEYSDFKNKYNITLNTQQDAAASSVYGPVLLLAVPGSGKTTVLVSRLGYMIYGLGINPENILTITYTVAATADMKKRFCAKFGEDVAERLEFRTINGISQKILQYFGSVSGRSPYQIASKESVWIIKNVFLKITGEYATENDVKTVATAISYAKNMMLSKQEMVKKEKEIPHFAEIFDRYNKSLKDMRLIDYDDQMIFALKILQSYPQVLSHFQEKYKFLCVDEAQDTSKIQHELIGLLASRDLNLFMVGDEDQSIYGFRAAYPEALTGFEEKYQNAKVLYMETNYRSVPAIVEVADTLIQKNKNRHKKHVKAVRTDKGVLRQLDVSSKSMQVNYLKDMTKDCDRKSAILYRNNESAIILVDAFEKEGLPYKIKGADISFFTHPCVMDICDIMRFAKDPSDKQLFLSLYYKVGAKIKKEYALSVINKNDSKDLFQELSRSPTLSLGAKKKCEKISKTLNIIKNASAEKAIAKILSDLQYQEYMKSKSMDENKAATLEYIGKGIASISEFLSRLEFLQETMKAGIGNKDGLVTLSTIHSSKGLEFDRVYLIDAVEGVLPSGGNLTEKNYEEERRLFYVAITRAVNELYIFNISSSATAPSPFIKEMFNKYTLIHPETKTKGIYQKNLKEIQDEDKNYKEFVKGKEIWHTKYGSGTIVDRGENRIKVNFPSIDRTIRLSLSMSVPTGIIWIPEERKK